MVAKVDKAIREKQILVEKKKQEEEKQQNQIIKNVNSAIHKIKNIRKSYLSYFESVINFIENFNELEIEALNSKLQIMNFIHPETQKPFLNQLIYKNENVEFIRFFLACQKIHVEVNKTDKNGITILQEIWNNSKMFSLKKKILIHSLFKRSYKLQKGDIQFLKEKYSDKKIREQEILRFRTYDKIAEKSLLDKIDKYLILICIIESVKKNKIIGYNLYDWKSFANNSIHHHAENWSYIEIAFRKYGLFDKLHKLDTKGTFSKKLYEYYNNLYSIEQDYKCDDLISHLYPEIYNN